MSYTRPELVGSQRLSNGKYHIQARFTGNNGEPPVTDECDVSTRAEADAWAADKIAALNAALTATADPTLQVGQVLASARPAAPARSAADLWLDGVAQLGHAVQFKQSLAAAGITNAALDAKILALANTLEQAFTASPNVLWAKL